MTSVPNMFQTSYTWNANIQKSRSLRMHPVGSFVAIFEFGEAVRVLQVSHCKLPDGTVLKDDGKAAGSQGQKTCF